MLQMLNVSALITGYETVGDHTEFIVQISCNGGLWLISRRFSDFDQLQARLLRSFGDLIDARLPEKQWFGRFDPNFLFKRQSGLQEYLESLLQVPGILEDRSLQHFLELEKHLELDGGLVLGGPGSNARSNGALASKSALLSENDRLSAIVENAAQIFIDISEVPEPLDIEQAVQRKNEIVHAALSQLHEQKFVDGFAAAVTAFRLPSPPVPRFTADNLIARLESSTEDEMSFEQEQELLLSTLQSAEESFHLSIAPPSMDLLALMDGAPALGNGSQSNTTSMGGNDEGDHRMSLGGSVSLSTSLS